MATYVPLTPPLLGSDSPNHTVESLSLGDAKFGNHARCLRYERRMGPTELSYFLPSRENGVNDIYLHVGFHAAPHLVTHERVRTIWAFLRLRHPLMCAHARMYDYDDVRFVYEPPRSVDDALMNADAHLEFRDQSKDMLIDTWLNGPRTLSNSRLSHLIISKPPHDALYTPPHTPERASFDLGADAVPSKSGSSQYEFLIGVTHFAGDGMALNMFADEFFALLGEGRSDMELAAMLEEEWCIRWIDHSTDVLPPSLEQGIPMSLAGFGKVAAKVDFALWQQKEVGGQTFQRQKHPERRTVVSTIALPEDRTTLVLKKCKAHNVSVSAAIFAACNVAWARVNGGGKNTPTLMYSAMNLRHHLSIPLPHPQDSYWRLAIGYFNVVLPAFLPSSRDEHEAIFWHRAQLARAQITRAATHPFLKQRTHLVAQQRATRAQTWAKEDDDRDTGRVRCQPLQASSTSGMQCVLPRRPTAPNSALLGLSLLGNMDNVYRHKAYRGIVLNGLNIGVRQRHGAMLLFGYTFKGCLRLSFGYDCNGFEGDTVSRFWKEVIDIIGEYML